MSNVVYICSDKVKGKVDAYGKAPCRDNSRRQEAIKVASQWAAAQRQIKRVREANKRYFLS